MQVFGPFERRATEQVDQNAVLHYYQQLPQADEHVDNAGGSGSQSQTGAYAAALVEFAQAVQDGRPARLFRHPARRTRAGREPLADDRD